jgi:carbonic anhydrase
VTEKNVRDSIDEIKARSSIIRELVDSGKVGIQGAMYDVSSGRVSFLAD